MLLKTQNVQYVNSVTHAGKVVLFGTDPVGKIFYSIKQDGFEDSYLNTPPNERTGWEDWQKLELPNEAEDDASVVEKETKEFTYQDNASKYILRSRYRTQDETAVAPVQLVSGMEHLYVFRQSKQNTLLCDRYVLDGIANKLVRKLQVRFKRSGQRFKASEKMKQGVGGLKNVDSLDYRDANGISFYEPTTELTFIDNLHQGWFSVIQLPTVEHAKYRWNIFAYNSQTQKIDLYSLRVSEEGLFDVYDYTIFEPKSEDDPTLLPRSIPGIIKRTLDLNVAVGNGISATKFYIQSSRETEAGTQLMRDTTKVMLALVTNDNNVATINFTALGDGTLSQINETPTTEILRSNIREVLLPLNTLDHIKAIGIASPPPEGTITAFHRTIADGIPHVQVTSPEASMLKNGEEIIIQDTNHYNGHYTITKIDETTFEIDTPWVENGSSNNEIGIWQVVPPQEQAVVFDGIITGYEMTSTGKLRVTAENHGLENGDEVQVFDTASYDGNYPITKVDDQKFVINNLRWQTGEAVNLKIQSQKRRGIVFDGVGDYIDCGSNILTESYTKEAWIKWTSGNPSNNIISGYGSHAFYLPNGKLSAGHNGKWDYVREATANATHTWIHVAVTYDSATQTMKLYKNGQLVDSATNVPNVNTSDRAIQVGAFNQPSRSLFKGQISDVRIWKVARTAQEIKNSMYLQLTGREVDLVGYWRLGGIAIDEENQRKVIDFSVNQNDGIVYGDCYVSAVTLNRQLGDGVTDAVQYSNKQVFAVTQQATYEETFEFKVTPEIDPNNVNGTQLFNCTYWGQKTHRSKDKISFPADITQIQAASEEGWYVASCRFTVPNEVNLVRCFEISDVVGTWETIEIRKQRIRKISDVITEADYNDAVTLSTLGTPQGQLVDELETLQQKEVDEQTLLIAKKETEELIEFVKGSDAQRQAQIKAKENEIAAQQIKVDQALGKKNDYENKLNLKAILYSSTNYGGDSLKLGRGQHNLTRHYRYGYYHTWNDQTSSIKIPSGLKVSWYQHDDLSGSSNTGNRSSYSNLGSLDNEITIVKVEPDGWNPSEVQNVLLPEAKRKWEIEKNTLAALKQELERLKSENNQHSLSELEEKLAAIIAKIKEVQTELNTVNTHILDTVKTTDNSSQRMPEIASNGDLVTTGAILDFIHPASRVTTLETVEGMVQLSYFDHQGKLRQGVFDATADEVNSYFEQWLPEHSPVCLNCDSGNKIINLGEPGVLLDKNWTIEVDFVYPFPQNARWNTLTKKTDGNRHILVKDGKYIGTEVEGEFYYCLIDSSISNDVANAYDIHAQISQGWHHLVVVGKTIIEGGVTTLKTLFYIDGEKIGECLVKNNSNIQHIGNSENGGEAFGKISELRIWNIALKEAEILANNQVYLTGNEPGLVAYYRLNEGSGTEARDHTGNGNNGTIVGENWWGNTKVLADPISKAMSFDGNGDYVEITDSNNLDFQASQDFTIEAWIKVTKVQNDTQYGDNSIIEKWQGYGGYPYVIRYLRSGSNIGKIFVARYDTSKSSSLVSTTTFDDELFHQIAFVGKGGSIYLYVDGQLEGSKVDEVGGNTTNNSPLYIGCRGGKQNFWTGQLAEVRVWSIGRTQAEIQANMNQRLTGQETGLELYLPLNKLSAEGAITKVFDLANNHHGTVYGATLTTANPQFVKEYTEVINEPITQVMSFDGSGDYIDSGNIDFARGDYTLETWFKTSASKQHSIFGATGSNHGILLEIGFDGKLRYLHRQPMGGGGGVNIYSPNTYNDGQWHHLAAVKQGTNTYLYVDGSQILKGSSATNFTQSLDVVIGQISKIGSIRYFQGDLAEFRVWSVARTQAKIQENMSKRLTGKEAGLELYLPLDNIQSGKVVDLANNLQGTVYGNTSINNDSSFPVTREVASGEYVLNSFPLNQGIDNIINADSFVTSVEYNTYDVNPITQKKSAMMRRMFAYPTEDGVQLLQDKRIENLELLWIGNAQFAPTLLGYIEGAPPVPSENMNIDGDYQYNGATSVQLTTTEDVEYSWNRSQDAGLGASIDFFTGAKSSSSAGLGFITEVESSKIGAKGELDFSYQWLNESNIVSNSTLAMTDRLELRGAPEVTPKFPHYGNRFIPKNVGYALVVSGLADVFITRLSRTHKMVGQEIRPVADIPPDVNTITFLMNPAYVMNGSLDGLVGSGAAHDEFYGHVPEMRAQYGSLYPASYFRLMEAYNLKRQIEKADKERLSYFENFNSNLVDEASLNRQAGDGTPIETVSLNEGAENIDASGQELTAEEKQAQLDQIQAEGGAKLEDLQKQGNERKQEINSRIDDIEQRTHALESFAGWQKNMENILVRSGKRNIVNTYVWDADGGLRVEEQSFANTTEHTIGGSFTMSGGIGVQMNLSILKVGVGLSAMATTNLTQTMTKTQASSKGMELNVDLSGIEILGITDENDVPFQPGEKVDRFRMMSFYLENSTDNYLDFFKYVVDPEWLASNDEEARALRQVQGGRPNKTWRVLHRVTYVERPTLMGFGRDMRSLAEIASYSQARMAWLIPANATVLDEVKIVRDRVEYLEQENAKLQAKLDKIIDWMNNH
ncbi:MAG: LamG-like jellyroll fold domain-containing protein [Cyanobacteria bacterium J06592_8]